MDRHMVVVILGQSAKLSVHLGVVSVVDIAAWLHDLGLERYEQAFCDNAIDAEVLPALTDADLERSGCFLAIARGC
jgi:hypothetical protein